MVMVAHHPAEIQPWLQMPYPGGTRGPNQDHRHHLEAKCNQCGKCNGCRGKKGTCPAWGNECDSCKGWNHYKAVYRKAPQTQGASGGARPKGGKGSKPFPGKAKKFNTHSMVLKMVLSGA